MSIPRIICLIGLFAILVSSGCATRLGPGSIKSSHRPYNDSVIETLNEQLLLNLVRLKYRDNPYFIEVSSITAQQSLEGTFAATGNLPTLSSRLQGIGIGGGGTYIDNPTITFQPLQGEEFIQKLMAPIPMEAILKLTQSGWSINRVLRLTVEQANHLHNAPTASGPTPDEAPEFQEFKNVAMRLRDLQKTHGLDVVLDGDDVAMVIDSSRISQSEGLEIRKMFGCASRGSKIELSTKPKKHRGPDELYIQPRSIIGMLFLLSHNIKVPNAHVDEGLVTVTRNEDGSPFDWGQVSGDLLQVHSSPSVPLSSFVKIRYRNTWFYIKDNDLESKSTFMLLNQLYNLLAGDIKKAAPVLTIPVG
ncbi:hypothetical protein VSU19_22180 [Verrucomicrobiales bacterium BCK34]|nr:hypothetical protein [Verrucomicrobiales bacterium BCK34]